MIPAAQALALAEDCGVDVRMSPDGVRLMLSGDQKPEGYVLTALFSLKDEILILLRSRQRAVEIDAAKLNAHVVREIADIETDALASGWGFDRLWYGGDNDTRGLAGMMIAGDHIAEVTPDCIRIERPRADRPSKSLYFFQCDA